MMLSHGGIFILLLGTIVMASSNLTGDREARDYSGFNPSPPIGYEGYDNAASFTSSEKWPQQVTSFQLPSFGCGGGGSVLRPLLAGLIGAALLKIPILLLAKFLLLKLALPFGLLAAAAPLALPLGYLFFSRNKESTSSTPAPPAESRALNDFLESSSCLERIACNLGHRQARSSTVKTFSWALKSMESVLNKQSIARSKVSSYRSAYLNGATTDGDSCASSYRCDLPELIMKQGESTYKIF